eukprot:3551082-Pleurochrysis_carterae.AAC.1
MIFYEVNSLAYQNFVGEHIHLFAFLCYPSLGRGLQFPGLGAARKMTPGKRVAATGYCQNSATEYFISYPTLVEACHLGTITHTNMQSNERVLSRRHAQLELKRRNGTHAVYKDSAKSSFASLDAACHAHLSPLVQQNHIAQSSQPRRKRYIDAASACKSNISRIAEGGNECSNLTRLKVALMRLERVALKKAEEQDPVNNRRSEGARERVRDRLSEGSGRRV